jgi:hypothetical protein
MKKLIAKYKKQHKEYQSLIDNFEKRGVENLNLEDTEDYGVYVGKKEILEQIIKDLTEYEKHKS